MKRERPILFSTPMVQSLLAERKKQTRRLTGLDAINDDPGYWNLFEGLSIDEKGRLVFQFHSDDGRSLASIPCPYGAVGDILWVRETWCQWYNKSGCFYKADQKYPGPLGSLVGRPVDYDESGRPWKPSIHMPKSAARIWLEITDIRVERAKDISEADARAEGIEQWPNSPDWKCYFGEPGRFTHPYDSFRSLWQKINGDESWQANPWVWVIQFKILSVTGKPETL